MSTDATWVYEIPLFVTIRKDTSLTLHDKNSSSRVFAENPRCGMKENLMKRCDWLGRSGSLEGCWWRDCNLVAKRFSWRCRAWWCGLGCCCCCCCCLLLLLLLMLMLMLLVFFLFCCFHFPAFFLVCRGWRRLDENKVLLFVAFWSFSCLYYLQCFFGTSSGKRLLFIYGVLAQRAFHHTCRKTQKLHQFRAFLETLLFAIFYSHSSATCWYLQCFVTP